MNVTWARVAVIVPTLWLGFGYNSLVMYAGLINIPKDIMRRRRWTARAG